MNTVTPIKIARMVGGIAEDWPFDVMGGGVGDEIELEEVEPVLELDEVGEGLEVEELWPIAIVL